MSWDEKQTEIERMRQSCAACEEAVSCDRQLLQDPNRQPGVYAVPRDFARDKLRHDAEKHDERLQELVS
jgi:hypothetical protein